jgi:hypothetical protein
MRREYIYESPQAGRKVRAVLEYAGGLDGSSPGVPVLALPKDTPGEVTMDILAAIRRAYDAAIEDRSAELIPGSEQPRDYLRDLVHAEALDAIGTWATGYSLASDGTGEVYVGLEKGDDGTGTLTMTVSERRHGEPLKRYLVRVLVEEVPGQ